VLMNGSCPSAAAQEPRGAGAAALFKVNLARPAAGPIAVGEFYAPAAGGQIIFT
jgi:hypothetical protein